MSIVFEPDTTETRKRMNDLARHATIVRLLQDIRTDMMICEIEGWDKTEYVHILQKMLNSIGKE